MNSIASVCWALGVAGALMYGAVAWKQAHNPVIWSLGGGLFTLLLSTIIIGLADAASIPFSLAQAKTFLAWETIGAALANLLAFAAVVAGSRYSEKRQSP